METLPPVATLLGGVDVSAAVILSVPGAMQRSVVRYECADGSSRDVQYINAAPNYLAVVPVEGHNLLFVTILGASGARYAAGQFEWWTRADEATLTDLTAPEGSAPLVCHEASEAP